MYIDTSAYTVKRYPPQLVHYLQTHGAKKVLFGTNYPMITAATALAGIEELGLSDETKKAFLFDNASRVYGLGTTTHQT